MNLSFTVPGPPVPCARPRVVNVGGHARAFMPAKTAAYEKHVKLCALAARSKVEWPTDRAAYAVDLTFFRDVARGDIDNMAKSCLDGLNGVLWGDDARVVRASIEVFDVFIGLPRAEVTVATIGSETLDEYRKRRSRERTKQRKHA